MNATYAWIAIAVSLVGLAAYEAWHVYNGRRRPQSIARTAHSQLRAEWIEALSLQAGSEILAVQTLRNSLMSATINASTAALVLMGTLTLAVSTSAGRGYEILLGLYRVTPRLALELLLMGTLFASFVCSAMAMRYFNHASYFVSLPIGSELRLRYGVNASFYLRRAGLLYSWGLRLFLVMAPIVAGLVNPLAMPAVTLLLMVVLHGFDRVPGHPRP